MCLYLYKELPLHLWKPSERDITLLRRWLLHTELGCTSNQLARLIVQGMNWGYNQLVWENFWIFRHDGTPP